MEREKFFMLAVMMHDNVWEGAGTWEGAVNSGGGGMTGWRRHDRVAAA